MIKRLVAVAVSLVVGGLDFARERTLVALGRPGRSSGVVLYYHGVRPRQRRRFARQLDRLLKCATPFRADETVPPHGRHAAITFDDGFQSVVENAVPELTKRGIPFMVFVPSGCLGGRPSWILDPTHPAWEERVLEPAAVRALAASPLATVGSHSVTHRNLAQLDLAEAREELARSKVELQAVVAAEVDTFSFPYGGFNARLLDLSRSVGYRRVFTIQPDPVELPPEHFAVARVGTDPDDWLVEFRLKLAGAYRWRKYIHRFRTPTAEP